MTIAFTGISAQPVATTMARRSPSHRNAGAEAASRPLCVVQAAPGDGTADVVQIDKGQTEAPNPRRGCFATKR